MVVFKMLDRCIGLVSTVILARMLVPEDFGLVAMSMVIIAALQLLVSFSFDVALIQNPKAGRDEFDTAWTFNVLFAIACGAVLALTAPLAARFYSEPRLELIIYVLAFGFVAQGLSNIGPVTFRRDMQFDREFKFLISKRLSTVLVTIPLALYAQNYWALVIGQLAGTLLSVGLSYRVSSYRPRVSFKARQALFSTSKWLVVNNIVQFLNNSAAQFIIGRYAGAPTLGVYAIATEIATLPTTELVAPINRAAFPGYAKNAGDLAQLRISFLGVISSISLFALPAGLGIVSVADLLVPAVLGWKWMAAIPLIQILAVYGVIQALQTNIGYVYLALGNVRLNTMIGGVQSIILLSLLFPAIHYWGGIGAAWAFLVTIILMIPVNQIMIARCLHLSTIELAKHLLRPFVSALVMATAVFGLKSVLHLRPVTLDYLLALFACSALGALVYTVTMYGLWRLAGFPAGPENFIFQKIESILAKAGLKINLRRP